MRNLKVTLAYDGTAYVGWQIQPNGISIQSVVEAAIEKLTLAPTKVLAAGRTDAGVHAAGQVISFHTASEIDCEQFRRGLQNFLPEDITVRQVEEAEEKFHATYSAISKRYRYVILNSRVGDPFVRNFAWHYWGELDAAAMHAAGQLLVGKHDFRCFESHWPNKATSVRTITELSVFRTPRFPGGETIVERTADGQFLCIEVEADGFLYNMVRAIVGTLQRVGRGDWTREDVQTILESGDRKLAGETAPACGLMLLSVKY